MQVSKKYRFIICFLTGLTGFALIYFPLLSRPNAVGIVDHDYFNAWQLAVNSSLRDGQLLHWMFWLCGGQPGLANPQSGALSPFNLFGLIFSPVLQFKLELVLNAALGLLGFLFLSQRLSQNYLPALPGFIIWAGNGLLFGRVLHGQTTYFTLLLMPLLIWVLFDFYKTALTLRSGVRHAVILALIFLFVIFQDGYHVLIYTAPALLLVTVGLAWQQRRWDLLLLLFVASLFSLLIALPRLLPVFDFLAAYPRNVTHFESVTPMALIKLLLDSDQLLYYATISREGADLFRLGYLAYIGLVPILLTAIYVVVPRSVIPKWSVLTALVIATWLSLGAIDSSSLWTMLSNLPLLENIRAPFKFIASTFLIVSLCTVFLACQFINDDTGVLKRQTVQALTLCTFLLLTMLYSWANWPLLNVALKDMQFPAATINMDESFVQANGDFNNSYPVIARNNGLLNCYEPTAFINYTNPDMPLIRARDNNGNLHMEIEPNRIKVSYDLTEPDVAVINQNYHTGWRHADNDDQLIIDENGLLALQLPAGKGMVTLQYESVGFRTGLYILFSVMAAIILTSLVLFRRT